MSRDDDLAADAYAHVSLRDLLLARAAAHGGDALLEEAAAVLSQPAPQEEPPTAGPADVSGDYYAAYGSCFVCRGCGDEFFNQTELSRHIDAEHPVPQEAPPEMPVSAEEWLTAECNRLRSAGAALAIAALRVVDTYDGVHRLALAVSEWTRVVADEGGRRERGGEG
jgi:hypothetical protein